MQPATILIVDDHPALRQGLVRVVENESDLMVCGEAASQAEVRRVIGSRKPDLILLDLSLDNTASAGIKFIAEIISMAPSMLILVYSMHDERVYAERALRAGARGYLSKQAPVKQMLEAIRVLLSGRVWVSEAINQQLLLQHVGSRGPADETPGPEKVLSERELEVFERIGQGLQPREIAEQLQISAKTIETHRLKIRKKLGLTSASALTRKALRWMVAQEL